MSTRHFRPSGQRLELRRTPGRLLLLPLPLRLLFLAPTQDDFGHGLTEMVFPSRLGQLHLPFALGIALTLLLIVQLDAMGATDAFYIVIRLHVFCSDWHATGMALIVAAPLQLVVDGHPIVEHEALALPQ